MTAIDRQILEFCRDEFRLLKPLIGPIPSATVYRHARGLRALGWLCKERGMYRTTDTGLRQLAEAASGRQWDRLKQLYPPLRLVPTAAHGAMAELILAAVPARQLETRPDRHPAFVAFAGTLHWKSSLGEFCCLALGLDPARHLVDCGAEAGKSLSVRRTGTGAPAFKRELLDAPFLVLDEFLTAEPAVRATLGVFLSGRSVVPFENQQLVIRPVPLLTLNPRSKDTLEARIGLSAAQIRRAILANFDAVPMPDLAMVGERALAAARTEEPLAVGTPTVDCKAYHRAIVNLIRAILLPTASDRVDVEVVINLCTGMSAFVPEPAEAIAQVGHALGLLAETMNWAQPGWLEPVTRFGLEAAPSVGARTASAQAIALRASDDTSGASEDPPAVRALVPAASRSARHELPHPDLSLSEALRMRLIWLAVDTKRSLEQTMSVLVDAYLLWRQQKVTFSTLLAILRLAEQLGIAEIEVETVYDYVKARTELAKHNCTFEDVPEALRVLDLLGELPEAWTWSQAHDAMRGVAHILNAGISADQLNTFLQRHQQLVELGLDEDAAEAIARAVGETGAMHERRDAVLREMAARADRCVDVAECEHELERLRAEGAALQAERERLRRLVKALTTRVHNLAQLEVAGQRRRAAIDAEAAATSSELGALRAFRALVQRKPGAGDIFCADLERLVRWLRSGGRPDDAQTTQLMTTWVQTLCTYLAELVAETRATQPAR